jgi:hypothetical protein
LKNPHRFFNRLSRTGIEAVFIDHFIQGDGTPDGSRTLKTRLPAVMAGVEPASIKLSYRDAVAEIARKYLPVGISSAGFAGVYSDS